MGGLSETNGSLLPGMTYKVTCRLNTCTMGSAMGSTLTNEYGRTLILPFTIKPLHPFQLIR